LGCRVAACADTSVAIEIDGDPARQDLDYTLAGRALAAGCLFALDSDAHTTEQFAYAETSTRARTLRRHTTRADCELLAAGSFARVALRSDSGTMMPTQTRLIRYAVVGLGHIAQVAVLPAFAHARRNSQLVAVVSDDRTKRRDIAKRYRLDRTFTYDQFDDCLREVDAVYIALPNSMHAEYTMRAARAGVTCCARSQWPSR
jgi:hypothetical protein